MLVDRLKSLADHLPENGSVTFTRADLLQLLDAESSDDAERATNSAPADYTVHDIARMLNRKPNTVRDWIKHKKLPAYVFMNREYRVTQVAFEEWRKAQREGGTKKAKPALPTSRVDLGSWRKYRQKPEKQP